MNIVFFGASQLGYECCELLLKNNYKIKGIFTIPKEFSIKYKKTGTEKVKNVLYQDFNVLGKKYDIPVFTINQDIKNYYNDFESLEPDFVLAIGWYYMLPTNFCILPKKGFAGIHASLLPKYRGNAPLVWAMINGEKETGVSFFYFDNDIDSGDIIGQKSFFIEEKDTIADILVKTTIASKEVLLEKLPEIENNSLKRIKQDHSKATIYPKRSPKDGEIDWNWDSQKIKNFINAQTKPYPGAFTTINGKKIILWDAEILDEK